jgi:polyisoprenoid-binding protein YceI
MLARHTLNCIRLALLCSLASAALPSLSQESLPVFVVTPEESKITFYVKASVALEGTFDKWDATITFTSPDVTTGVLDIKIQAEDFFDVKQDPLITFHADKVVHTGPTALEMPGTFTIRRVSKPETLTFTVTGKGTGSGEIKGTMAFDRKDYGMNKGIFFIKIADRVEVTVDLKGKRVSGPPLVFKQ